jgi:DNA-directed RNA polymerase subunit omega
MTDTRIDELLDKAESKFALVIGASKRTRQITDFLNARNPGDVSDDNAAPPPVADLMVKKPLMIALDEIADGKVDIIHAEPDDEDAQANAEDILGIKSPEETMEAGDHNEPVEEAAEEELREALPDES